MVRPKEVQGPEPSQSYVSTAPGEDLDGGSKQMAENSSPIRSSNHTRETAAKEKQENEPTSTSALGSNERCPSTSRRPALTQDPGPPGHEHEADEEDARAKGWQRSSDTDETEIYRPDQTTSANDFLLNDPPQSTLEHEAEREDKSANEKRASNYRRETCSSQSNCPSAKPTSNQGPGSDLQTGGSGKETRNWTQGKTGDSLSLGTSSKSRSSQFSPQSSTSPASSQTDREGTRNEKKREGLDPGLTSRVDVLRSQKQSTKSTREAATAKQQTGRQEKQGDLNDANSGPVRHSTLPQLSHRPPERSEAPSSSRQTPNSTPSWTRSAIRGHSRSRGFFRRYMQEDLSAPRGNRGVEMHIRYASARIHEITAHNAPFSIRICRHPFTRRCNASDCNLSYRIQDDDLVFTLAVNDESYHRKECGPSVFHITCLERRLILCSRPVARHMELDIESLDEGEVGVLVRNVEVCRNTKEMFKDLGDGRIAFWSPDSEVGRGVMSEELSKQYRHMFSMALRSKGVIR